LVKFGIIASIMTLPSGDALRGLSREELITIILHLADDVRRLEAEVHRLETEVERLKKLPTTSQNSSQPPSRDWKKDDPGRKRHRKQGAKPGHPQAQRPLVDNPTYKMLSCRAAKHLVELNPLSAPRRFAPVPTCAHRGGGPEQC
jgi:hypothetical protein